jgi:predicted transcriptional regulator
MQNYNNPIVDAVMRKKPFSVLSKIAQNDGQAISNYTENMTDFSYVRWFITQLENNNFVKTKREGRNRHVFMTDKGMKFFRNLADIHYLLKGAK